MPIDTDVGNRITALILQRIPKSECGWELSPEESEAWDRYAADIADIQARGGIVSIPAEHPDPTARQTEIPTPDPNTRPGQMADDAPPSNPVIPEAE